MEQIQSKAFRAGYINAVEEVLFEERKSINGKVYQIGHTTRYVKVAKETTEDLANKLIEGKITGFLCDDILLME